jgi:hypothetical protein
MTRGDSLDGTLSLIADISSRVYQEVDRKLTEAGSNG